MEKICLLIAITKLVLPMQHYEICLFERASRETKVFLTLVSPRPSSPLMFVPMTRGIIDWCWVTIAMVGPTAIWLALKVLTFSGCLMHRLYLASLSWRIPHIKRLFSVSMAAERFQQLIFWNLGDFIFYFLPEFCEEEDS